MSVETDLIAGACMGRAGSTAAMPAEVTTAPQPSSSRASVSASTSRVGFASGSRR
ncbi:hypothetical protein [Brevundimonas viscosa]|uniref:hypothetical protein n=1 Tax=Brevundimonas viscosa TaxID=871741 RepID=UPI0015A66E3C|nr:hypothetical protein [Brevundimonas viscosa]